MGEVYKARDTRLNRTVAIKVLAEDFSLDADRRQRFEREARVVASLSHPNICALHDVGTESSSSGESARAYIVMEFLEGETLEDRLARGPLPLPDIIRYGADVATALHAAHRQHIVHRDLKPGNIMITRSGVKLLDFGLAKPADPMFAASDAHSTRVLTNVTMAGAVMGTVPYMAPEQLEGRARRLAQRHFRPRGRPPRDGHRKTRVQRFQSGIDRLGDPDVRSAPDCVVISFGSDRSRLSGA